MGAGSTTKSPTANCQFVQSGLLDSIDCQAARPPHALLGHCRKPEWRPRWPQRHTEATPSPPADPKWGVWGHRSRGRPKTGPLTASKPGNRSFHTVWPLPGCGGAGIFALLMGGNVRHCPSNQAPDCFPEQPQRFQLLSYFARMYSTVCWTEKIRSCIGIYHISVPENTNTNVAVHQGYVGPKPLNSPLQGLFGVQAPAKALGASR